MGLNQTTTEFHSTEPNSTEPHSTEPGSEQPSGGNSVLAIVLGSVGGLIALLLIAILVVLIIGQRMKAVQQTSAIQEYGYDDLPCLCYANKTQDSIKYARKFKNRHHSK